MSDAPDKRLLEALLVSWARSNTIMVNLLRAIPRDDLEVRAILLLQHMLWHEGYHHGQIKLALELAGR